jgi:hypothetical protein
VQGGRPSGRPGASTAVVIVLGRNHHFLSEEKSAVTLGIRVPETDRFGSSGIRVIRVPRNWNRSVPSSVSGNSVSGSGNSVRFRVFPNGTEKMKK